MATATKVIQFIDAMGQRPAAAVAKRLACADPLNTARFYRALGFDITTEDAPGGDQVFAARCPGLVLKLVDKTQLAADQADTALNFLVGPDLKTVCSAALAAGGRPVKRPFNTPLGTTV